MSESQEMKPEATLFTLDLLYTKAGDVLSGYSMKLLC
jgi:hypothetical protein